MAKPTSGSMAAQAGATRTGHRAETALSSGPTGPREFLSLFEVGQLLGVGRCRAWELAQSGALPAIRLGRRWYVPRRALDALVDGAIERSREARSRGDGGP